MNAVQIGTGDLDTTGVRAALPPCAGLWLKIPTSRQFAMGREGFEPSTLGLRVPCSTS
jgi:hypothetical protein